MGHFFRKIGRSGLFYLKKWWEWVRVAGSGWERNSVKPLSNWIARLNAFAKETSLSYFWKVIKLQQRFCAKIIETQQ